MRSWKVVREARVVVIQQLPKCSLWFSVFQYIYHFVNYRYGIIYQQKKIYVHSIFIIFQKHFIKLYLSYCLHFANDILSIILHPKSRIQNCHKKKHWKILTLGWLDVFIANLKGLSTSKASGLRLQISSWSKYLRKSLKDIQNSPSA
jgi:hypothetical protein